MRVQSLWISFSRVFHFVSVRICLSPGSAYEGVKGFEKDILVFMLF